MYKFEILFCANGIAQEDTCPGGGRYTLETDLEVE